MILPQVHLRNVYSLVEIGYEPHCEALADYTSACSDMNVKPPKSHKSPRDIWGPTISEA